MTSSTSQPTYVYVIVRLKMSESINGIDGSLFCHYGEIDDAFLIGGLVEPDETLTASFIIPTLVLVISTYKHHIHHL